MRKARLQIGLSIPRHFSFPGDSGNRGMLFFHSSGNGELKVIPRGIGSGNRGIGELKGDYLRFLGRVIGEQNHFPTTKKVV